MKHTMKKLLAALLACLLLVGSVAALAEEKNDNEFYENQPDELEGDLTTLTGEGGNDESDLTTLTGEGANNENEENIDNTFTPEPGLEYGGQLSAPQGALSQMAGMDAAALDPVSYMAWNGTTLVEKTDDDACTNYTVVTADTTTFEDGKWYVVSNSVTVSSRITVTGTVNLILCDGATLTAGKGITVNSSNTLNIYAQSAGTGELSAGNDINAASIGGGARYQSGGIVNIHGGKITATGGYGAAGIGGALQGGNGEVNIYGGNVTAQGSNFAAGIGGYSGKSGGTVSIYGGTVNASGSINGVGIGIGGTEPGSCIVNIYGGDVTASSGKQSGIQGTVTIDGGTVTANGGTYDSNLSGFSGTTVAYNGISGTVTINGGTVSATGGNVTGGITNFGGNIYACNGIGGTVTINGGTVTATGGSHTGDFGNYGGTTVKEKGFGGSLTLGTGMYLYGGTSANPESNLSNYRAGAGDYTGDRYVYMTVNNVGPHIHSFTYTATDATITAACTAGCDITEGLALTISAPTELTYDGSAKAATLSTGYNTTAFPGEYMIKYYKGANEVEAANVKAAGDYTAKVTVGEATASVDFTIAKATPSIETIPTASAVTYGQKLADSALTGGAAKLGDTTVAGTFAWKNTETKPAVSDSNATEYDVVFTPTDADNYAAVECKVKLTVNKAEPTVTAPTAKTLTYNGQAQELVTAGKADGGDIYYELGTDAVNAPSGMGADKAIPTGTDAGTYYVWYKAVGDANHNDSAAKCVTVTIAPKKEETKPEPAPAPQPDPAPAQPQPQPEPAPAPQPDPAPAPAEPAPAPVPVDPREVLITTSTSTGDFSFNTTWNAVQGADGYDVFFTHCSNYDFKLVATVPAGQPLSYDFADLNKYQGYKVIIKAWQGASGNYIKESPVAHCYTGGGTAKLSNPGSLTLKKTALTIKLGKSASVGATVKGVKKGKVIAHDGKVRYLSSDPSVVTISRGKMKAVGAGACTVYVLTTNGIYQPVAVTVDANPTSVKLSKPTRGMKIGQTQALGAKVVLKPKGAVTTLTWTSSKPEVVSVDAYGNVTALSKGRATITVTTANGKKTKLNIRVK